MSGGYLSHEMQAIVIISTYLQPPQVLQQSECSMDIFEAFRWPRDVLHLRISLRPGHGGRDPARNGGLAGEGSSPVFPSIQTAVPGAVSRLSALGTE